MAAWVLGLGLAAGYLINKNLAVRARLEDAEAEYRDVHVESTGGATSAEVRKAWRNTDHTRFGEMAEDLPESEKQKIDRLTRAQQSAAEQFDAAEALPSIQGVWLEQPWN